MKHVLIIQDSPAQAVKLKSLLEGIGYKVHATHSGMEALACLDRIKPDIVISDLQMPGMDGFQLCREIKGNNCLKDLRVILVMPLLETSEIVKSLECGADGLLFRPYSSEIVIDCLDCTVPVSGSLPDRDRILNILLSTYINSVTNNRQLVEIQDQLAQANTTLETKLSELKAIEERFRTVVQTIPDIVYRIDKNGNFTFLNDAIQNLGYTPEELIGKNFRELIAAPEETPPGRSDLLPSLRGSETGDTLAPKLFDERRTDDRRTRNLEVMLKIKGDIDTIQGQLSTVVDSARVMEVSSSGLYVSGDDADSREFLGSVGIIRDITERKQAEEELKYHREQLEMKVRERTEELEQVLAKLEREVAEREKTSQEKIQLETQLRRSQRLETIGTLAGGIAHDFNNILTPIFGYLGMVQSQLAPDSDAYAKLSNVNKAANRARDLVKQILVFSREVEQEKTIVEFQLLIKEVLKLLHATLPSTIEIRQDISPDAGAILADPSQMHQVLMNLCTNAYQAMRDTSGVLEVKLERFDVDADFITTHPNLKEGRHVRLTVSDTGCGMEKEIADRIFEPFFTTRETGEGTGLGLSVVHGIVASHGGEITVNSEPGEGTSFKVYLPWVDIETEVEDPEEEVDLKGQERILFVDDEEAIADLGREMLQDFGYDVTVMISSVEALEMFKKSPDRFDLIITDQIMPDMTGTELIEEVMKLRDDIPVILTSGFSEVVTPEKMGELGIRDYIRKPFILKELGAAIRKAVEAGKDPVR